MTIRFIIKLWVLTVSFTFALGDPASQAQAETALYTGFTLLDPDTETRTPDAYMLVEDGRIAALGSGAPPAGLLADEAHDMTGLYALPGFIDAHGHVTVGLQKVAINDGAPLLYHEADEAVTEHAGRIALAFGVTTMRNPAGDPEANASYDARIASGEWLGPEVLHAGAIIEPPPMGGPSVAYPRTPEEWDAEAAREAALGMRYLKLYTDLSEDEIAEGVRAAHAHGLKAIAHLNTVSWTRAAELGVDGLEHALPTSPDLLEPEARAEYLAGLGPDSKFMYRWFELADYDGPLFRELVDTLADRRITTNMTLVVNELVYNLDRLDEVAGPEWRALELPQSLENWRTTILGSGAGWTPEDYERARAAMPKVLEFTRRLHDAGVPMMIGTDSRGGTTFYARELELHVEAGIPVWEVLRMATSKTADILEIGDRTGRVREGYEADVAFLEADPSLDIASAERVRAVLTNGDLLIAATLKGEAQ